MARAQLDTLLRYVQKLAAGYGSLERTDRQLVDGFSARRDEAAFAALVARHGSMVLRVCRRVLGHEQDAEDAFQDAPHEGRSELLRQPLDLLVQHALYIIPRRADRRLAHHGPKPRLVVSSPGRTALDFQGGPVRDAVQPLG